MVAEGPCLAVAFDTFRVPKRVADFEFTISGFPGWSLFCTVLMCHIRHTLDFYDFLVHVGRQIYSLLKFSNDRNSSVYLARPSRVLKMHISLTSSFSFYKKTIRIGILFRLLDCLGSIGTVLLHIAAVTGSTPPPNTYANSRYLPHFHRSFSTHTKPKTLEVDWNFINQLAMDINSNPQNSSEQLDKICIIGSGNWGSAIATLVGRNCERLPYFENQVNMWVYEEQIPDPEEEGKMSNLTDIINTRHENVKYLPGITLPKNVVAFPDLAEACRNATLLIFVLPHQFLPRLLPVIRESAHHNCRGVSLIKGLGKFPMTFAMK